MSITHCFDALYNAYARLVLIRGNSVSPRLADGCRSPDIIEKIHAFGEIIQELDRNNLQSDSEIDFPELEAARESRYRVQELVSAASRYNLLTRKNNNFLDASPDAPSGTSFPYLLDASRQNLDPVRFIGVAGPSCAGKSTAIRALSALYDFVYLPADHFFCKQAAEKIYGYDNWETPASLMFDELYRCMIQLRRGEPCIIPSAMFTEDFSTLLYPGKVVVVDGFLLFTDPRVRELLDVRVFIDVAKAVQLERRILKTSESRRDYILRVVVPQYEKHRDAIISDSHFLLDGNLDRDTLKRDLRRVFRDCGVFGS